MIERHPQLSSLQELMDRPGPAFVTLHAPRGAGLTSFLAHALGDTQEVRFTLPDLADEDQRSLLGGALDRRFGKPEQPVPYLRPIPTLTPRRADDHSRPPHWEDLLASVAVRSAPAGRRYVLTLEDVDRAALGSAKLTEALALGWNAIRKRSFPLLLLLTSRDRKSLDDLAGPESPLGSLVDARLALEPLTLRGTSELLSGWRPMDRARAWALLGGLPGRLALLDTSRSLRRNLRSLFLEPSGPFSLEMDRLLGGIQSLTHPARYGSLLRAVALGSETWSEIREGIPGEDGFGRPGPYAERLQALGLLSAETSLDARRGSRKRRYRVTDPLLTGWHRFVVPNHPELLRGEAGRIWTEIVEPGLDDLLSGSLARAVRELLVLRGNEVVGSEAREAGAIWSPECEIPVAGTLRNGAVFYGLAAGADDPPDLRQLSHLESQIRETRYGFGKERRLRLLASLSEPDTALKAAAAREDGIRVLGARDLLGEGLT